MILTASAELLAEGGVDALTTRSLAERTGIPVATIYRYFDNRDEILAAYLNHELEQIERAVQSALMRLERVTFRSMIEAIALAHMHHHQTHPAGVQVWFGGRLNAMVVDRVSALDVRLASSLRSAMEGTGMIRGAPEYGADLLVRLFDRTFEYVFLAERAPAEQEEIILGFVDLISTYVERFATTAGVQGIPSGEFLRVLGHTSALPDSAAPRTDEG